MIKAQLCIDGTLRGASERAPLLDRSTGEPLCEMTLGSGRETSPRGAIS